MNRAVASLVCSAFVASFLSHATGQQASGVAGDSAQRAPAAPAKPVLANTLMDGTPIKLRLGRTLSSADEKSGNEVNFEVLEEVKVNDVVVIPKGSLAVGSVTEAEHKKNMGRGGKLDVAMDYVRMGDGEKATVTATEGGKAGGHTGAMAGAMVATSIIFFPAAPLFLFMHGKDLVIPKGTEVTAYVNGDTPLTMSRFAPGEQTSVPAAGTQGQVSIEANVSSCEVDVDGAFAGNTPTQLALTPGNHKITVSQDGYIAWSRTVLVTNSGLHLRADLTAVANSPAVSAARKKQ